jgi:hypothetical protein
MFDPNDIVIETKYIIEDKRWLAYFGQRTTDKYYILDDYIRNGATEEEAIYNLKQCIRDRMDFFTDVHNAIYHEGR